MNDGILLQSVEGLGDSPFVASGGEIWATLQSEKEEICREILAEGPLVDGAVVGDLENTAPEIELRYRSSLENRLREINDAQDRLADGHFGECVVCGGPIGAKRLAADPAASLCINCQKAIEGNMSFHTM
jgi:RNA polymerase-binding transcription factor DksA